MDCSEWERHSWCSLASRATSANYVYFDIELPKDSNFGFDGLYMERLRHEMLSFKPEKKVQTDLPVFTSVKGR